MSFFLDFGRALINGTFVATALKVSLVVGSLLFAINHGTALFTHEMTPARWISGAMTYAVPYSVSIYSQMVTQRRQQESLTVDTLLPGK